MRKIHNFNDNWLFLEHDLKSNNSFLPIGELDYDDQNWRTIKLPHDSSIEGEFKENNAAGPRGGYAHTVLCYYRKHFFLQEEDKDSKIYMTFQGVAGKYTVFVNGAKVGGYPYSYTTVTYDITKLVEFGKENLIAVKVDNELQPASRWYSGTGIYRDVVMTIVPKVHMCSQTVQITTPIVEKDFSVVEGKFHIENQEDVSNRIYTSMVVKNQQGEEVARSQEKTFVLGIGAEEAVTETVMVKNPALWSSDEPNLYYAEICMRTSENEQDVLKIPFGIRTIAFTPDQGFLINGKQEKLKGVCLHHDNGCLGACEYKDAMYKKLVLMKEMGANAIRTTHNPESPQFLELCDELGFYVLEEAFDEWTSGKRPRIFGEINERRPIFSYAQYFNEYAKKDLETMICRDRNHPSIVLWSIGNEIEELRREEGEEITSWLTHIVHSKDMTRPVTVGCNGMAAINNTKNPEMVDVCGYNYAEEFYPEDHKKHPERVIVGTEICSAVFFEKRGEYKKFLNVSLQGETKEDQEIADPETAIAKVEGEGFTINRLLRAENAVYAHHNLDYACGYFIWTGVDYLGEPTPHVWPSISSYFAPVDRALFKKDSFYFYQSIWTDKPVLHILPNWSLPGYENKNVPVICFTNCDQVELFVNGKSYGVKKLSDEKSYHLGWENVVYEPGEIKAIGTYKGKEICEEISTPKKAEKLRVSLDEGQECAEELIYLTVEITDEDGKLVTTEDQEISIEVDSTLEIAGVDNGDPTNHTVKGDKINSLHGLARIVVKTLCAGEHKVIVKGKDIKEGTITF